MHRLPCVLLSGPGGEPAFEFLFVLFARFIGEEARVFCSTGVTNCRAQSAPLLVAGYGNRDPAVRT